MAQRVNKAYEIIFNEKGPVAGMKYCLQGQFINSALILCYSLIDAMAWLALPENRHEVQREDFISWSEQYVLPSSGLECTAEDLYAARCGVVHTMTPESRLSKIGKATQIVYAWGSKKPYPREKLQTLGMRWAMIHVDTLCQAVERGAERFLIESLNDKNQLRAINVRADKIFREDKRLPDELP